MSITPFPSQGQYPWYDQLEQWGADTQTAAENATIAADQVHADVATSVSAATQAALDAQEAQVAATNAAGLVGAPAGEAVLAAISEGGAARGELTTAIAASLPSVHVRDYGAVGDGITNDSAAIQAALNVLNAAGGGTCSFHSGKFRASNLTAIGALTFQGTGGADHLDGVVPTKWGSVLTPAVAGAPILTVSSSRRLRWRGLDMIHDRSFDADGLILGGTPGSGSGTFWPDIDITVSGFKGWGVRVVGTVWESALKSVHVRRCGDGAADKASVEVDDLNAASDGDTLQFDAPNVIFPQGIGFRMRSAARPTSATSPGFRRLRLIGGMFHAGFVGGVVTDRYDADMIVLDGFASAEVDGPNIASVAPGRFAIRAEGTLMDYGSARLRIDNATLNGPIYIGNVKDVIIGRNNWLFWIPGEYPEHIYVSSEAVRTTIEDQHVLNGGDLVVTDMASDTIKPSSETVTIPAMEFKASVGTPTISQVASRFPAMLMDHTVVEQVNAILPIPHHWRKFNIELVWANISTSTGNVRWQLGYSSCIDGADAAVGDVFPPAVTAIAPSQNIIASTTLATGVSNGRGVWHARISRQATAPEDTLNADDAAIIAIRLRRTL